MRIFGVYGIDCSEDLSHKVFQGLFEHYQISDAFYQVMSIPPRAVTGAIESIRQADMAAVNILWPYQEFVTELVEEADHLTETAFACNTIMGQGDFLSAHNTNGQGFVEAINSVLDFDFKDKQVLLLGAGAIARTIATVVAEAGAKEVLLANRTKDRAVENAKNLAAKTGKNISGCGWDDHGLAEYLQAADLIVNCTFLGDSKHQAEIPAPAILDNIHSGQVVADVTIKPAETPFLQKAKAQGAVIVPGYLIYLYQSLATHKLWTNEEADKDVVEAIIKKEIGL